MMKYKILKFENVITFTVNKKKQIDFALLKTVHVAKMGCWNLNMGTEPDVKFNLKYTPPPPQGSHENIYAHPCINHLNRSILFGFFRGPNQ